MAPTFTQHARRITYQLILERLDGIVTMLWRDAPELPAGVLAYLEHRDRQSGDDHFILVRVVKWRACTVAVERLDTGEVLSVDPDALSLIVAAIPTDHPKPGLGRERPWR